MIVRWKLKWTVEKPTFGKDPWEIYYETSSLSHWNDYYKVQQRSIVRTIVFCRSCRVHFCHVIHCTHNCAVALRHRFHAYVVSVFNGQLLRRRGNYTLYRDSVHTKDDFGAISVAKRRCVAPISKRGESHIEQVFILYRIAFRLAARKTVIQYSVKISLDFVHTIQLLIGYLFLWHENHTGQGFCSHIRTVMAAPFL